MTRKTRSGPSAASARGSSATGGISRLDVAQRAFDRGADTSCGSRSALELRQSASFQSGWPASLSSRRVAAVCGPGGDLQLRDRGSGSRRGRHAGARPPRARRPEATTKSTCGLHFSSAGMRGFFCLRPETSSVASARAARRRRPGRIAEQAGRREDEDARLRAGPVRAHRRRDGRGGGSAALCGQLDHRGGEQRGDRAVEAASGGRSARRSRWSGSGSQSPRRTAPSFSTCSSSVSSVEDEAAVLLEQVGEVDRALLAAGLGAGAERQHRDAGDRRLDLGAGVQGDDGVGLGEQPGERRRLDLGLRLRRPRRHRGRPSPPRRARPPGAGAGRRGRRAAWARDARTASSQRSKIVRSAGATFGDEPR